MKKVPERTCMGCNEKKGKKELIRIVRTPEGKVEIDLTGKANGRGAYLKKDKEVIEKARKNKILEKHLEIKIEDNIYDKLISNC